MKNNFVEYAKFYDQFNVGKDYATEVLYIDSLIKKFKPDAQKILDISCGTGLHDIELAKLKYDVVGIDISNEMIEIAKTKSKDSNLNVNFYFDSEKNFNLNYKFDVVVSLFHVTSYQTNDESLVKFFDLAYNNLKSGGIFIFDYWFSPAVHFLKLEERTKSVIADGKSIQKRSKPTIISSNLFNVDITISLEDYELTESHLMRSFVSQDFSQITNFESIDSFAWLTEQNPNSTNWTAVSIIQKK